jgi:D-sedoheptulose 7-phosphate isomerase
MATVTALANDVGFDVVFARPLATLARPGDAVVGLSTSGGSANVLAGLRHATSSGLRTIGLAGYGGGEMASAGLDVLLAVASDSVHRIQEAQVALYSEVLRRAGLG